MIKVLFIDTIFARLIDFRQLLLDFTLLSKQHLEATKKKTLSNSASDFNDSLSAKAR